MTRVTAASPDAIRVILCLKFDHRAAFDEVARLKRAIIDGAETLHAVEAEGDFDFMIEAEVHGFGAYQAMIDRHARAFATLVERHDTSFVCRRHLREPHASERWLWVPTSDGRRRIETRHVDRVSAEGDYVRLHCGGDSFLLHATMHALEEILDVTRFVRLHRSVIVRRDIVKRLVHRNHRWFALLADGAELRISRSHLGETLAAFDNHWATHTVDSAKLTAIGRSNAPIGVKAAAALQ